MTLADTSAIVAAFAVWHDQHEAVDKAVGDGGPLIAHCALETFSTLTRMPAPGRASPGTVLEFLGSRFSDDLITLSPSGHRSLLESLLAFEISGGATYDALVAATAAEAGATLVTCDRRAMPVYESFAIDVELLPARALNTS